MRQAWPGVGRRGGHRSCTPVVMRTCMTWFSRRPRTRNVSACPCPPTLCGITDSRVGPRTLEPMSSDARSFAEIVCTKCGESFSPEEEWGCVKKHKQADGHKVCMNNYKSLVRRWMKNTKLKTWWAAKTEAEQQQWYRDNTWADNYNQLAKRKKNLTLMCTTVQEMQSGQMEKRRVQWQPFTIYKRNKMVEGATAEEALRLWRVDMMDGSVPKKKVGEHWCIAEFQGLDEESFQGTRLVNELRESRSDLTADELREAIGDGRGYIAKASAANVVTLPPSSSCSAANVPEDMIVGAVLGCHAGADDFEKSVLQGFDALEEARVSEQMLWHQYEWEAEGYEAPQPATQDINMTRMVAQEMVTKTKLRMQARSTHKHARTIGLTHDSTHPTLPNRAHNDLTPRPHPSPLPHPHTPHRPVTPAHTSHPATPGLPPPTPPSPAPHAHCRQHRRSRQTRTQLHTARAVWGGLAVEGDGREYAAVIMHASVWRRVQSSPSLSLSLAHSLPRGR